MIITIKYSKDNTTPFIWNIDVCCKNASKHLFHPIVDNPRIGVPEESKMRIFKSQKKVTMNNVSINFCPFCGSSIDFFVFYLEFSIDDLNFDSVDNA